MHTRHARPDAVTVQIDPAMSLGLNLDDFLCVSDMRYYVLSLCVITSLFTRTGRTFWMLRVKIAPISSHLYR